MAKECLRRFSAELGKDSLEFEPEARQAIKDYPWPGNVRELQNRIKRGVIMAEGKRLTADDLELPTTAMALPGASLKEAREAAERETIQRALRKHGGKITAAAIELGISRPTLYELMEKLNLRKE